MAAALDALPAPAKIQVNDLTMQYGTFTALERVTLRIQPGEFVSLLGPSGCGKSTLLTLMAGLERPSSGSILLGARPVTGPGADRGMVFQSYTLYPWLTVEENIEFGPALRRVPLAERRAASRRYLEIMDLTPFARVYPRQLSGGMKQRVAIARALANHPAVLLMDEPFGALDALTRQTMQELLLRVWEQERTTVVFVTHDIDEAIFLSERIYVMAARPGRIQAEFAVPLARHRSPDVKDTPAFTGLRRKITALLHRGDHPL